MKASLIIAAATLCLGGCATAVQRIPAQNSKLAAQGWEQAAAPVPIRGFGLNATRTLVCRKATCGGPAVYMAGSGPLSSGTVFGNALLTAMNSPEIDTGRIRAGLITASQRQSSGQVTNIEDIQKIGNDLRITANANARLSNGSLGTMLMHMTASGKTLNFEATLGANRAMAQDLFKLAALAH